MGSRDSQISKISYDPIQDRMVSEAFKTDSKHTPLPTQRVMYWNEDKDFKVISFGF